MFLSMDTEKIPFTYRGRGLFTETKQQFPRAKEREREERDRPGIKDVLSIAYAIPSASEQEARDLGHTHAKSDTVMPSERTAIPFRRCLDWNAVFTNVGRECERGTSEIRMPLKQGYGFAALYIYIVQPNQSRVKRIAIGNRSGSHSLFVCREQDGS